jgi:hypothetical protein
MKTSPIILYIASLIFICLGFHKLYAYENSEYGETVNAYVGSDAHNFIINTGYATSFFILALILSIVATGLLILDKLTDVYKQLGGNTDNQKINKEVPINNISGSIND